jgi:hypothetical protein
MAKDRFDKRDDLKKAVLAGKISLEDAAQKYYNLFSPFKKMTIKEAQKNVEYWTKKKEITSADFLKIAELTAEKEYNYSVIGLRATDKKIRKGQRLARSWKWEVGTGNRTGVRLDGVCTVSIDCALAGKAWTYEGDRIVLVGGDSYEYGNDQGELIITNPVAIEVFTF